MLRHPPRATPLTPWPSMPAVPPVARVLVVDDREASRHVTAQVLRQAGYEVVEAECGAVALARLAEPWSAVVLDLRLPDMDGGEVCRRIRAHPTAARVPVLHLSAYASSGSVRAAGLDGGADAFLTQPVDPDELRATVRALVRTHRAEAEVRRVAREWAATFDAISDAVCLVGADGLLLRCNLAMAALLRVPGERAVGQQLARLLHEALGARDGAALLRQILAAGTGATEERVGAAWFAVRVTPVPDEHGAEVGRLCVLTDVTAARRARETQRVLADVTHALATAPDLIGGLAAVPSVVAGGLAEWCGAFTLDEQGIHVVATEGPPGWLGDADDLVPLDEDTLDEAAASTRTGELRAIVRHQLLGRGGARRACGARPAALGAAAVLPPSGDVSWLVAPLAVADALRGARRAVLVLGTSARRHVFDDRDVDVARELAHRLQLAAERARLLAESEDARREALRLQEVAERANVAKSEFLAAMSHEIRTPLNAVIGYAELLALEVAGPLTSTQGHHLARIQAAGRHLNGLVSNVLDLAKIEAGHLEIEDREVDARESVLEALALARPLAVTAGLTLGDGATAAAPLRYRGDPARVKQILVNMLSNAIKFTDAGGRVTVSGARVVATAPTAHLFRAAEWVTVSVADTGPGIAPAEQALVFDPFVQGGDARTRRDAGTGLGLAISRRLARMMHGDLVVDSVPGRGATFTLWLPAEPSAAGPDVDAHRGGRAPVG